MRHLNVDNQENNSNFNELLEIELALLANESLMQALVSKWHAKPASIGEDIYLIASTIIKNNKHETGLSRFNKQIL